MHYHFMRQCFDSAMLENHVYHCLFSFKTFLVYWISVHRTSLVSTITVLVETVKHLLRSLSVRLLYSYISFVYEIKLFVYFYFVCKRIVKC